LNEQLVIRCIIYYIDVFISEFPHNTMYPRSFHTHAGTHRVDSFVVRLYCNLGAFARYTDNLLYCNEPVEYLGNLKFEQPFEEDRRCTAENDERSVVSHFNLNHHGAD